MRPLFITLKNFGSYKSETVSFEDFDIAVISGESGSGKSTIPDAIIWALYGRSERDSVLSHAADEKKDNVEVTLQFELEGQVYEINRKRGSKSDLTVFTVDENGSRENISAKGIKAVDAQIQELLGMDYQTFRLTAFVPQDGVNTFANLGPADRKRFLEQFLDTAVWNKCLERAKKEEQTIQCRKAVLDSDLKRCTDLLAEEDKTASRLEEYRGMLKNMDNAIQEKSNEIEALTARKIEDEMAGKNLAGIYETNLKRLDAIESEIISLSSEIEALSSSLTAVVVPQRTMEDIRRDIDEMHIAQQKFSECSAKIKESERIESLLSEKLAAAEKRAKDSAMQSENILAEITVLNGKIKNS